MATTKRLPSPPKTNTNVGCLIKYILNPEKTTDEKCAYSDSINCSIIGAVDQFKAVREMWDKNNGNFAYHFEQSFKPGETTPEEAHQCGKELAEKLFGADGYQVVFATHLDKDHLHNHFAVNAVNPRTGKKLQTDHDFIRRMREENDTVCRAHNLSVIETPSGNGKTYAEWLIEKNGGFTWRGAIRKDIDNLIPTVLTFKELLRALEKQGYTVRRRGKYLGLSPPGTNTNFRFNKLGKGYSEEAITDKILYSFKRAPNPTYAKPIKKNYSNLKGNFPIKRKGGFRGLYYSYIYRLRRLTNSPKTQSKMPLQARSDAKMLREFSADLNLLFDYKIDNVVQLADLFKELSEKKHNLCSLRLELRQSLADCGSQEELKEVKENISSVNETVKKLDKQMQSCKRIYDRTERMKTTNKQMAVVEKGMIEERLQDNKDKPSDNRVGGHFRKE